MSMMMTTGGLLATAAVTPLSVFLPGSVFMTVGGHWAHGNLVKHWRSGGQTQE